MVFISLYNRHVRNAHAPWIWLFSTCRHCRMLLMSGMIYNWSLILCPKIAKHVKFWACPDLLLLWSRCCLRNHLLLWDTHRRSVGHPAWVDLLWLSHRYWCLLNRRLAYHLLLRNTHGRSVGHHACIAVLRLAHNNWLLLLLRCLPVHRSRRHYTVIKQHGIRIWHLVLWLRGRLETL